MSASVFTSVSEEPLDMPAHEHFAGSSGAGAIVTFRGVVRDHDAGRTVTELEYQGHPTAAAVLADVAAGFADEDGVIAIAVSHRVGVLAIGDVALAAAVSAPHRGEAFDVCARLVDEVKRRLPVWKRQQFADGSDEWVNCP